MSFTGFAFYIDVRYGFDKDLYLTSSLNAHNHNTCIRLPQTRVLATLPLCQKEVNMYGITNVLQEFVAPSEGQSAYIFGNINNQYFVNYICVGQHAHSKSCYANYCLFRHTTY